VSGLLARIYQQHRQGFFVLALSITRCAADAEDAVHDAFARMCRFPKPAGRDMAAYAFVAVRNAATDRLRRRRPGVEPALSLAACLETALVLAENRERDQAIAGAVDGLPEDLQTVVLLRFFGGLTFKQISELVGAPLPTVASRSASALERLRPQLRKWL
jgi:RNA polymerase sigma-70 factor (ECF subfamily)